MSTKYYLDHAAATPLDHDVNAAMAPLRDRLFHNPSSVSLEAQAVRKAILDARKTIARVLRCRPYEVVFTSGGTESNNLAIFGVARGVAKPGHIITSSIEHASVLEPIRALKKHGWKVTELPVDAYGRVDLEQLRRALTKQTRLVSIMLANNEVGTIQPIAEVAQLVKQYNSRILVHTDACQATGALALNVQRLGVDLLTINGSKCYGPKGSGVLFVRSGVVIEPVLYGGGQEKHLRAGTENVPAIVGLGCAVAKAEHMRTEEVKRLERIRDAMIRALQSAIPGTELNGPTRNRLANNIHLSFPRVSGEQLVVYLEKYGVIAATGAACTTASAKPSHVLIAMGLSKARIRGSLRMTLGRSTTRTDIAKIVALVQKSVETIQALNASI